MKEKVQFFMIHNIQYHLTCMITVISLFFTVWVSDNGSICACNDSQAISRWPEGLCTKWHHFNMSGTTWRFQPCTPPMASYLSGMCLGGMWWCSVAWSEGQCSWETLQVIVGWNSRGDFPNHVSFVMVTWCRYGHQECLLWEHMLLTVVMLRVIRWPQLTSVLVLDFYPSCLMHAINHWRHNGWCNPVGGGSCTAWHHTSPRLPIPNGCPPHQWLRLTSPQHQYHTNRLDQHSSCRSRFTKWSSQQHQNQWLQQQWSKQSSTY